VVAEEPKSRNQEEGPLIMGCRFKHAQIIVAIPTSSFLDNTILTCQYTSLESTSIIIMSAQFQQSTHSTMIIEPLATAIEANKPSYLATNISTEKPGSMGTPPPSQISSPGKTLQNIVQSSDKVSEALPQLASQDNGFWSPSVEYQHFPAWRTYCTPLP
jgi:hypothetical protein